MTVRRPFLITILLAATAACSFHLSAADASPLTGASGDAGNDCPLPLRASDRAPRVLWLKSSLSQAIATFESAHAAGGALVCPPSEKQSPSVNVHDFGDYALAKRVLSPERADLADAALRCLFSYEVDDPGGADDGLFPFHLGDEPRLRDNSNEFALLPLAAIVTGGALSPATVAELEPKVVRALARIDAHVVCTDYTNICLMQTAELIALGQWLAKSADATTAANGRARVEKGVAQLDSFIAATRDAGIVEFDSPTYSEVDLETLLVAFRAAPDDATRAKVRAILDYLWTDLAANTFAGSGTLAGPQSRTYDFLTGQGGLTVSLFLEGLRADTSQAADLSKASLLANESDPHGYRAPQDALSTNTILPREILSTWGKAPGRERTAYVTEDYSLGTTSADYGTSLESDQDMMVRAELAATGKTPGIEVIPDYLDAPGTKVQAGDFSKVTHLLASPASAQRAGAALTLLRVPARPPKYVDGSGSPVPLVNLATNVVFPSESGAEVTVDGVPVDLGADTIVSSRPTLVVHIGAGVVAVSVLDASGVECPAEGGGVRAVTQLEAHVEPLAPASAARDASARLVLYHATTLPDPSTLAPCFARVALLLVGAHCDATATCATQATLRAQAAAAAANVTFEPSSGDWDVRVRPAGGAELHVHRVVGANERVVAREVDGQPVVFPPLSIAGRPVSIGM
jgi:hypothetical protein